MMCTPGQGFSSLNEIPFLIEQPIISQQFLCNDLYEYIPARPKLSSPLEVVLRRCGITDTSKFCYLVIILLLLTVLYSSGPKDRGTKPSHFARGSGNVARKCLQQLEALKIVESHEDGGRKLSSTGRRDLDRIAAQMMK